MFVYENNKFVQTKCLGRKIILGYHVRSHHIEIMIMIITDDKIIVKLRLYDVAAVMMEDSLQPAMSFVYNNNIH